jgi:hypothetical protein
MSSALARALLWTEAGIMIQALPAWQSHLSIAAIGDLNVASTRANQGGCKCSQLRNSTQHFLPKPLLDSSLS